MYSILGWNTIVGPWTRIEGTPFDPNPNKPFAKLELEDLFLPNGRLSPSITIIGTEIGIFVLYIVFSFLDYNLLIVLRISYTNVLVWFFHIGSTIIGTENWQL